MELFAQELRILSSFKVQVILYKIEVQENLLHFTQTFSLTMPVGNKLEFIQN